MTVSVGQQKRYIILGLDLKIWISLSSPSLDSGFRQHDNEVEPYSGWSFIRLGRTGMTNRGC